MESRRCVHIAVLHKQCFHPALVWALAEGPQRMGSYKMSLMIGEINTKNLPKGRF